MSITAENIRDDVVGNLGNRTDLSDPKIYRHIHYAQLRVARLKAFNELNAQENFNTVAETRAYTFPVSVDARRIRKIDSIIPELVSTAKYERVLTRVATIKQWNKILSGTDIADTSNVPRFYLRRLVTQVQIQPIPDDIYRMHVDYTLYPVETTESNKTDQLALYNAEDLILFLASSILSYRLGREKDGQRWFNLYRGTVREMVAEEEDYGDFDMQAVSVDLGISSPSDYWKDPFYRGTIQNQVI